MLTKETVVSQISVDEHGNVSVRRSTRVMEDGVLLSESYHRHVVEPGDDLTAEAPEVAAIAAVAHTKERKDARAAREADRQATMEASPLIQ